MAGAHPQHPEKQVDTVLSVANAEFDRKFSKLKHLDKKDIVTVLECCIPGGCFTDLEHLSIAILYPGLALDCNRIRFTLQSLAELTAAGPAALSNFRAITANSSSSSNSLLDDPISAIPNLHRELWRWEYGFNNPIQAWERWVSVEARPALDKDAVRDALGALGQHLSDIWDVNTSVIERSKEAAMVSGVDRIQCIAEVAQRARDVMQLKIAPGLHSCKARLDQLEKAEHDFDPVVISIDPANGATGDANPFQGANIVYSQRSAWLSIHAWFKSAKRGTVIWNQNLQYRANGLALVVLLAINPVVWILLAALPFTVLSTLLCGMPDAAPAIDSDFFAGLSSTVSGLAGLFAIISSLRRPDPYDTKRRKRWKIESQFPRTFVALLGVSVLSGIASVIVYPWESPWSIPLAFVSNVAQNVATLLIVQGSAQRITELER